MRTLRIKEKIVEFLEENGPQPTNKILDHLNDVLRWGSTSQQLGNVLSKGKAFDKVEQHNDKESAEADTKLLFGVSKRTEHG